MKWLRKHNLDEMQELKLLKTESRGFWIGFIGLFLSIAVQAFLYGPENARSTLAGEFIIFLCMGLYLIAGCLHNGIWDRHLPSTPAVNIGLSWLAAAITALFNAILSYRNYGDMTGALIVFVLYFTITGVTLSFALCVLAALYHRKRNRLEEEVPDKKD